MAFLLIYFAETERQMDRSIQIMLSALLKHTQKQLIPERLHSMYAGRMCIECSEWCALFSCNVCALKTVRIKSLHAATTWVKIRCIHSEKRLTGSQGEMFSVRYFQSIPTTSPFQFFFPYSAHLIYCRNVYWKGKRLLHNCLEKRHFTGNQSQTEPKKKISFIRQTGLIYRLWQRVLNLPQTVNMHDASLFRDFLFETNSPWPWTLCHPRAHKSAVWWSVLAWHWWFSLSALLSTREGRQGKARQAHARRKNPRKVSLAYTVESTL